MVKKPCANRNNTLAEKPAGDALANLAGSLNASEPKDPEDPKDPGHASIAAPNAPAPVPLPLNQDPELLNDFLVEAREHLANIEARLLEVEHGCSNGETLHSAFRSFHTLKGLAGFLEFGVMQSVAHEVETVLDRARNDELQITPAIVDVVLESADYVALWLSHISRVSDGADSEAPGEPTALIQQIRAIGDGSFAKVVVPDPAESALLTATESAPIGASAPDPAKPVNSKREEPAASEGTHVVKVATAKLEYLVDMVGELVIAESMWHHNPELDGIKTPRMQRDLNHLGRVTAEVQKTAVAMRMVSIGQLFRKMTRLVRDLARKSNKKAELELVGENVELDRKLVEELGDPLVHMIRNSLDHGLETPAERVAAGKPESGRVRLVARHQSGEIHIEISDDGRGLDREKILSKAIERGLISSGHEMTDSEIYQLIFRPGFSTAERVTEVSGRGVGMDVVWKHLHRLRGRVEIHSTPGSGTTFVLRLPLTLAIIDGLVVLCGGERFIVPIFSVREMFRPARDAVFTVQGKGEMILIREHLLPLVRLKRRLALASGIDDPCEALVIVGESEGRQFCLLVDALIGKQEVVIKNLGPAFSSIRGLAGGAILGDGRVGLILDLADLVGLKEHAGTY
jgi:two-component system chemotaxis sensor kinase CheA